MKGILAVSFSPSRRGSRGAVLPTALQLRGLHHPLLASRWALIAAMLERGDEAEHHLGEGVAQLLVVGWLRWVLL